MMLYYLMGLLTILVMLVLMRPILRPSRDGDASFREVEIYRDQLTEVGRDADRGLLSEDEASAAKNEIERRLLLAARRQKATTSTTTKTSRLAVLIGIALIPLVAVPIYFKIGQPDQPSRPFAERDFQQERIALREQQIEDLKARLQADPNNMEIATLLARTYRQDQKFGMAIEVYKFIIGRTGGRDPQMVGELAELMVLTNNGIVSPEAEQIFSLLKADLPQAPQATFYIALAKAQRGESAQAIQDLQQLSATLPEDAPFMVAVQSLLGQLQKGGVPQTAPSQQTANDADVVQSEGVFAQMVRAQEARLQQSPDDVEGWHRLARAYIIQEDRQKADAAYRQILELAPNDPVATGYFSAIEN